MKRAIRVDSLDNVGVAVEELSCGDEVAVEEGFTHVSGHSRQAVMPGLSNSECVTIVQPIKRGHKLALRDIPKGHPIVKYGVPIGRSKRTIRAGEHVHDHNVEDITEELCRRYNADYRRRRPMK